MEPAEPPPSKPAPPTTEELVRIINAAWHDLDYGRMVEAGHFPPATPLPTMKDLASAHRRIDQLHARRRRAARGSRRRDAARCRGQRCVEA